MRGNRGEKPAGGERELSRLKNFQSNHRVQRHTGWCHGGKPLERLEEDDIVFRERDHREIADIRLRSMTSGKETATTVLKVAGGLVGTALLVWPLAIW